MGGSDAERLTCFWAKSDAGGQPLRAWVDESGSDQTRDPGAYVLAAAVGCRESEEGTRERMLQLRLRRQSKLHWRDEGESRRESIIHTVAACDLELIVVVFSGHVEDRPERRRRKCLETMLFTLGAGRVTDIILESRGKADDRRDIELINALRGRPSLDHSTRLTHVIGRQEPMLWVPDAVCGAVTSARTGYQGYLDILGPRLTIITI